MSVESPPANTGSTTEPVALVDLLDRLLAGGVVISGDVVISIAEVDLVRISLRAMIASVDEQISGMDVFGHPIIHE